MDIQYLLWLQDLRMASGGIFDEFFNAISNFAVDIMPFLPYIIFWYDPFGKTFAELEPEEKNAVSHRGAAIAGLALELRKKIEEKKEQVWREYGL